MSRQDWWNFAQKYQKHFAFMPFYQDFLDKKFQWINNIPPQDYIQEQ